MTNSIHNAMQAIFSTGLEDFCIGGESVYRLLLPNCDRVFVTKVLAETDADAHFPNLDATDEWIIESESEIMEEDGLRFRYVEYVPCEEDPDILSDSSEVSTGPTLFVPPADFSSYHGF